MASFNKVILMGNLTRDPELRYLPNGTALAKFGLAVNRQWRTETGEQREEVTFVDVEAWRQTAETVGKYMRKGSPILIEGRLKMDQWDDKQTGQKRSKLMVVCDNFSFVGPAAPRDPNAPPDQPSSAPVRSRPAPAAPAAAASSAPEPSEPDMPSNEDDDVPF
jgi:single-strand DNA-binding protein